jgi:uncharacterized Zn finger protein (UPF0148 family)
MGTDESSADRPRYCPYCGEPVGWFFGRFTADGGVWCERCQDWFRVERIDEGTSEGGRTLDNEDSETGRAPSEGGDTP